MLLARFFTSITGAAVRIGVEYQIVKSRIPLLKHCYVVTVTETVQPLSEAQQIELIDAALRFAREKSQAVYGTAESFTILLSGQGTRRICTFHVHVAVLNSRWKKAWFYFVLFAKNILQALGWRRDSRTS